MVNPIGVYFVIFEGLYFKPMLKDFPQKIFSLYHKSHNLPIAIENLI